MSKNQLNVESVLQDYLASVEKAVTAKFGRPFKADEVTMLAVTRVNDGKEVRVVQATEIAMLKVSEEGDGDKAYEVHMVARG